MASKSVKTSVSKTKVKTKQKARQRAIRGTSVLSKVKSMFLLMVAEAQANKGKVSDDTLKKAVELQSQVPQKQVVGLTPEVRLQMVEERLNHIFATNFADSDEKEVRRLLNRKMKLTAQLKNK